jgi:RimJ/RimL family protein N-acetyltransferase
LGLSKGIVKESFNFLKSKTKTIKIIKALIKKNNIKSIELFKSLGFEFEKEVDMNREKVLEYVLNLKLFLLFFKINF